MLQSKRPTPGPPGNARTVTLLARPREGGQAACIRGRALHTCPAAGRETGRRLLPPSSRDPAFHAWERGQHSHEHMLIRVHSSRRGTPRRSHPWPRTPACASPCGISRLKGAACRPSGGSTKTGQVMLREAGTTAAVTRHATPRTGQPQRWRPRPGQVGRGEVMGRSELVRARLHSSANLLSSHQKLL